jgi:hypothetical protein
MTNEHWVPTHFVPVLPIDVVTVDINRLQEHVDMDVEKEEVSPDLCVGKYVIVKYNSLPYPGYVQDAGESDLYVECMHRIGKKGKNCSLTNDNILIVTKWLKIRTAYLKIK